MISISNLIVWTRTGDILLCAEPLLAVGLRHSLAKYLIRATSHVTLSSGEVALLQVKFP